jgi:hypothetical protein
MSQLIRVLGPYQSYDFGNGIPVVTKYGTTVSDSQWAQITALLAAMTPKLRPRIVAGPDGSPPPPEINWASEAWVLSQLASVVAGNVVPIKFRQSAPAATWTIHHSRNTKPDVVLLTDGDGNERVYTDVSYPDDSTVVVEWPVPTSGWAYIQ